MDVRRSVLKDRVAQAYHDFGRFCSAHPASCLLFSILSILVLSYPAVARLRLPEISPIDVHWNEQPVFKNDETAPEWLKSTQPILVQQIVVRSGVDPWNSVNLTTEQSVRGPLSLSFDVTNLIHSTDGIGSDCFHIPHSNFLLKLPNKGCLLLSPTLFWKTMDRFKIDQNVVETVFNSECEATFCLRDALLGIPVTKTGIKKYYQTNRKRTIDYAITIFLAEYDSQTLANIRKKLTEKNRYSLEHSTEGDERTYVHVFYRPRKYLSDYLPIVCTFLVFMLYIYYSARKFEMVSSRAGLAIAAAVNVAATLFMTTGLCAYLDIVPTLWAAEIFPYIILVVVTENTMIITKSVVNTPPTLDVSSRIAHGLSQEGYSLCKYFLLEISFLIVGYGTGVSEIQEFCILATVGLVVDFYMQLFFFAPCLTLDLRRLNANEKQKFARMMLKSEIPHLKNFTPVRKVFPQMFDEKQWKKRRLSDSQLDERETTPQVPLVKNRRANSVNDSEEPETSLGVFGKTKSVRLALLTFVTRTRIMQRSIMVFFAVWVVWLAFIVHSKSASEHKPLFGISHRVLESAPQAWGGWQRRTFSWWPELFSHYNMSISGHYLTFLPPIVISAKVSPSDPLLFATPDHSKTTKPAQKAEEPHELQSRINWLETQLRLYMATFFILLISTVAAFILYIFFWDKWRQFRTGQKEKHLSPLNSYSPGFETVPTVFNGHRFPIECVVATDRLLVSACQEGRIYVWNMETGERMGKLNRLRMPATADGPPPPVPPQIWCLDSDPFICVTGCSDGSIEVGCLSRHKLIGVYQQSKIGVVHIKIHDSRLILARLDGSVDFVELSLTEDKPRRVASITLAKSIRAHSKPISQMKTTGTWLITSSHDYTVKIFDTVSCEVVHTLLAHNAPVTSICVDESRKILLTACEEGVIGWWDLETAELIRSVRSGHSNPILLTLCGVYVVAASNDGTIGLYDVTNGQKEGALSSNESPSSGSLSLLAINGEIICTGQGHVITFWDTREKAIIRQINMGLCVDGLLRLSGGYNSVLCQAGNTLYKVNVPSLLSR